MQSRPRESLSAVAESLSANNLALLSLSLLHLLHVEHNHFVAISINLLVYSVVITMHLRVAKVVATSCIEITSFCIHNIGEINKCFGTLLSEFLFLSNEYYS